MTAFPWRWVLLWQAMATVLLCITGWVWLTSTNDLAAFAVEAKAAGISLDPVTIDLNADAWWATRESELSAIPYYADYGDHAADPPQNFTKAFESRFDQVGAWVDQAPLGRIK